MTDSTTQRPRIVLDGVYYAVSICFFLYMLYYYWTGEGGPTLLAMTMIPVTFVLFTLQALRQGDLYPTLPAAANYLIATAYCAFSLYCSYYMNANYMSLGEERAGMWNTQDLVVGGAMTLLIIEYARKRHLPLFVLNIILVLYAVYGYLVPGMFHHAGLSWNRLITASSVEMATGIFSRLPEIALTVIGSFLLVLSLLRGFGCVDSLLRATKRVAIRSSHAIPQSAVIGSMAIGTVSGSGAANSITVGTGHHSGHDQRRIAASHRGGNRECVLDGRATHAAGHGHCRLPDGRIPRRRLLRCGCAGLGPGPHLLHHGRDFGLSVGKPLPHPPGRRSQCQAAGLA